MDNGTLPENGTKTIDQSTPSARLLAKDELSIIDMLQTLLRYKWVAIGTTLIILAASITYAFTANPNYRATTIIVQARSGNSGIGGMISQFGGALGSIAGMFGGGGGAGPSKLARGEALTTLTTTAHIQNFIRSKNLLPILFAGSWDQETEKWIVESEADIPTLSDGHSIFREKLLTVEEDPLTRIITLSVEWRDPDLAAEWANELVSTLNANLRAKAIENSDKTVEYLTQELERVRVVELRQALFFMIEQQIAEKTSARVQQDFAFKIIDPAIAPDPDKYFFPNRKVIITAGLLGGIIAGLFAAFFAQIIVRLRQEYLAK